MRIGEITNCLPSDIYRLPSGVYTCSCMKHKYWGSLIGSAFRISVLIAFASPLPFFHLCYISCFSNRRKTAPWVCSIFSLSIPTPPPRGRLWTRANSHFSDYMFRSIPAGDQDVAQRSLVSGERLCTPCAFGCCGPRSVHLRLQPLLRLWLAGYKEYNSYYPQAQILGDANSQPITPQQPLQLRSTVK